MGKYIKMIVMVILLLSFNHLSWSSYNGKTTIQKPSPFSFCDRLDSIIHERNINFKNVIGKMYWKENDSVLHYLSNLNINKSACEIIFKKNRWYFAGFLNNGLTYDSTSAAMLYDSLRANMYNCLPGWDSINLIDSRRNFPFTRFTKDSTQLELYYLKDNEDATYTIGVVVEPWD